MTTSSKLQNAWNFLIDDPDRIRSIGSRKLGVCQSLGGLVLFVYPKIREAGCYNAFDVAFAVLTDGTERHPERNRVMWLFTDTEEAFLRAKSRVENLRPAPQQCQRTLGPVVN
jgi:hypothetical protein